MLASNRISIALAFVVSTAMLSVPVVPALALEQGDIPVRLRGIGVMPASHSGGIAPDLLTSSPDPQPAIIPDLDFTYMATRTSGSS